MNNTFDFHRFGLLLKKHWVEKRKGYLIGLAAYVSILLICYLLAMRGEEQDQTGMFRGDLRENVQIGIYFAGLFIGGAIYAGLMFTDYNRKESAVFNILLPASHWEKASVYILYGVFFFWVAYTACYLLVDFIGVLIFNSDHVKVFFPLQSKEGDVINVYVIQVVFLFTQTLLILGSIYFRRFAFFKTIIALVTIALLIMPIVFSDTGLIGLVDYNVTNMTFSSTDYNTGLYDYYYKETYKIAQFSTPVVACIYIAGFLLFAGMCSVVYLRLKEKEI